MLLIDIDISHNRLLHKWNENVNKLLPKTVIREDPKDFQRVCPT